MTTDAKKTEEAAGGAATGQENTAPETTIKPEDMTEEQQNEMLQQSAYEVGARAEAESGMVISQAQRLFYEYWNQGGCNESIQKGKAQFDFCMRMAEEIRDISAKDFKARLLKADAEFKKWHKSAAAKDPEHDGVQRIIPAPSAAWAQHRMSQPGRMVQ
jgi:hypothetical protein